MEMLDGEMVLFHPADLQLLYSNQSGALIWQLCDGQRTVAEISQILSATYPEAADKIQGDVRQTLDAFARHGALVWQ